MLHDAVWEDKKVMVKRLVEANLVDEEILKMLDNAVPTKVDTGIYLCKGVSAFNPSLFLLTKLRDRYNEMVDEIAYASTEEERKAIRDKYIDRPTRYGVCDDFEQAIEYCKLRERPEKYFIAFTEVRKDEQSSEGGWRWHKWGEYIGKHEPQFEYLYDEPDIEKVYVFEVFEIAE